MAAYHTLWTYLWDLLDDDLQEVVDLLGGEIGLDAVSVATSYHSFQQLRPHRPGHKLLASSTAAVYFQPEWSLYQDTCLRPHVAAMCRQDNPLERLAQVSSARGLDLISWTVCLHNSYLAAAYPRCAEQGPYGDILGWSLCPFSDDVRAYVIALCRDLAENYGISRLELESCCFGGYGHAHHHRKEGVDLGNIGRYLFGLSFSEGCLTRCRSSGLDPESLRSWVVQLLDRVLVGGAPLEGDVGEFMGGHPDLAVFQKMREEAVVSLVREIEATCGVEVSFILMGDPWTTGARKEQIMGAADLVEILAYTDSPAVVEERVREVVSGPEESGRLVVGLQAYYPCATSEAVLSAQVQRAANLGVRHFSYYNYGIMPRPNLQWIKSCIKTIEDIDKAG